MRKYTFIDLFAGCGGLSEGFLASGHLRGLAHVEWELPMVETLRRRLVDRWNETPEEAERRVVYFDIQNTEELINGSWSEQLITRYLPSNAPSAAGGLRELIGDESVDLIIGGPPCQAYSIHGRATDKNSMRDDYRNYLFESFVKVVDVFRPKAFIFENVTGMLSAKPGGRAVVDRIYDAVDAIGYTILKPESFKDAVFNAYNYSVPQNRERVILFAVRKDESIQLSSFYDNLSQSESKNHYTVRDAIGDLPPIYPLENIEKVKGRNVSHYATSDKDRHHQPRHCSKRDISVIREWIGNDMNNCTQQEAIDFYRRVTGRTTLYRKYRNLEWDKPSPTVVAHLQKDGFMFIHPDIRQSRFLTVREAALLMTFPMDYEFIGNRAYCYKMIGNAVPVNFAKAIANALFKTLNQN